MPTLNTDKPWKKYGKRNPYFGVVARDKFLGKNLTQSVKKEFFDSGIKYVENIFEHLKNEFDRDFRPESALDFGCGTGRLTIPIAERSDHVTGIDISDDMLDEAGNNSRESGVKNVSFRNANEFLQNLKDEQFDFIHSFIVFQHINPDRGEKIFEKLYKSLKIGGIGVIHFTYSNTKMRSKRIMSLFTYRIPFLNNFRNLLIGKPFDLPLMQMNSYNLNRIFFLLHQRGVGKTFLQFTDHGGHQGIILYFKREKITNNV